MAGAGERVLFVSGYEAAALSTVTVAGQDRKTNTAEINIEVGEDPLFVIASSYTPMIWRVTGAVERVSRFVTGSSVGGAGVVGLGKDRVTFVEGRNCLKGWNEPANIKAGGLDIFAASIGSPIFGALSSYALSRVILPKDALPTTVLQDARKRVPVEFSWGPLRPGDNVAITALKAYSPGGIVEVDPAAVVSSQGAESYVTLPQEAGLAQLLQNGALEFDGKLGYVIRRPISALPAGLGGAHSVVFVLAEGVPRPAGPSTVLTLRQAKKASSEDGTFQINRFIRQQLEQLKAP